MSATETRSLLDAIDLGSIVGLRDRALIGVIVYSFARVSAVVGIAHQDYFAQVSAGGSVSTKRRQAPQRPAHHLAQAYLVRIWPPSSRGAEGAAVSERRSEGWGVDRARSEEVELCAVIKRSTAAADLPPSTCCHTLGATGIITYLANGGTIEQAQQIAADASRKTPKPVRPHGGFISLDESRGSRSEDELRDPNWRRPRRPRSEELTTSICCGSSPGGGERDRLRRACECGNCLRIDLKGYRLHQDAMITSAIRFRRATP